MIARLLESQSPGEGKKWKILMGNKEKSRRFREKPNSVTNPSSTIRDPAHCSLMHQTVPKHARPCVSKYSRLYSQLGQ